MNATRIICGVVILVEVALAPAAGAGSPPRPTEGHGNSFYLLAAVESLDFDLDPRGSDEFLAAGLDPTVDEGGVFVGVGWVFGKPLRLDLTAGGWRADIDREGTDCYLGRAAAELHVAVAEGAVGSLEATFSAAFLFLNYEVAGGSEHIPGSSVGLGATGRLKIVGPVGLGVTYQYQLGRFSPTTLEFEGSEPFRVQPTARMHGVRVSVFVDI